MLQHCSTHTEINSGEAHSGIYGWVQDINSVESVSNFHQENLQTDVFLRVYYLKCSECFGNRKVKYLPTHSKLNLLMFIV